MCPRSKYRAQTRRTVSLLQWMPKGCDRRIRSASSNFIMLSLESVARGCQQRRQSPCASTKTTTAFVARMRKAQGRNTIAVLLNKDSMFWQSKVCLERLSIHLMLLCVCCWSF